MRNRSRNIAIAFGIAAAAGLGSTALADTAITSLTTGDIVVLRGGNATTPDTITTTNQVPLYLDEYTASGTYVGSMDVPSTGPNALTLPGIGDFQHEGILSDSTNGQLLTFAGYQVAAGSADAFAQTGSSQYQPVIGSISIPGGASSLSTTTVVNSYNNGSANPYIRGAVTEDGNEYWTFGKYPSSGATSGGGINYVTGSGASATTTPVEGFVDARDLTIVNGQLFMGSGSSSVGTHGGYAVSSGLPTTNLGNSQTNNTLLTDYAGGQSASALALLNIPTTDSNAGTQYGADVMYTIGDQGTAGIVKYYYDPTGSVGTTGGATADTGAWVPASTDLGLNLSDNVVNPTGLIAVPDPSNPSWVDLFVSGTNGIYEYTDTSGDPTTALPSSGGYADFTLIASPSSDEAFYGVAMVPEPASIGLLAMGGFGLLARRRRRKA